MFFRQLRDVSRWLIYRPQQASSDSAECTKLSCWSASPESGLLKSAFINMDRPNQKRCTIVLLKSRKVGWLALCLGGASIYAKKDIFKK